jgi:hypothetical protein
MERPSPLSAPQDGDTVYERAVESMWADVHSASLDTVVPAFPDPREILASCVPIITDSEFLMNDFLI